jgi:hypothetical protein
MPTPTQHGYLVLADISGYTSYLAGVELDHAHDILTDLLENVVGSLKTLLTISKLEGDAVFGYVPEAQVSRGETLLELVEATYLAFRSRQETVGRATTCACNACRAIPQLDLKFIVHHGEFIVQHVAGIRELVGTDVNLAHRLLKNHVSEATGWRAYALFTEPAAAHLAMLRDPDVTHAQVEAYEHLGEVKTCSFDLHARYAELLSSRHVEVAAEAADVVLRKVVPAALPTVWEWLNDPRRRTQVSPHNVWTAVPGPSGRSGVGARNHCAHGKGSSTETVLDWRPFDYYTVRHDISQRLSFTATGRLVPMGDSQTEIVYAAQMHVAGLPRPLERLVGKAFLQPDLVRIMDGLARCLADQAATEVEAAAAA